MATVPETTLYRTFADSHSTADLLPPFAGHATAHRADSVRRRPTPEQGRALEMLGHAIEYLIDSELRYSDAVPSKNAGDAARILMALSREVFAECAEVVPVARRLHRCLTNMFGRHTIQAPLRPGPHL